MNQYGKSTSLKIRRIQPFSNLSRYALLSERLGNELHYLYVANVNITHDELLLRGALVADDSTECV